MADVTKKNPKVVTITGARLSFPVFSYQEALKRNATSQYPRETEKVTPEFSMLLEQHHLDKFITHVRDVFLPHCADQYAKNPKEKDALEPKHVARLHKVLEAQQWDEQPPYIPIKPVSEKTQEMAPEAVASLKVFGNRATDVSQMAVVTDEDELVNHDGTQLVFPVIKPIRETVHQLYPGAIVGATLNLYAFISGSTPGFSASSSTVVFKADAERFGGGVDYDEDEIFA